MSLTPDEERVVVLRQRDGRGHIHTITEIAGLMNMTPARVRKLEEQARRKLGVKRLGDEQIEKLGRA